MEKKELPPQYKPLPVYIYERPIDEEKRTPYTRFIAKKILKFTRYHYSIKAHSQYQFVITLKIISLFIVEFALSFLSMFIWESPAHEDGSKYQLLMGSLSWISLICAILFLFFIVIYIVYVSYFFYSSLSLFMKTKKYHEICDNYSSLKKITHLKNKEIKTLFKMKFITKELYEVYKKSIAD